MKNSALSCALGRWRAMKEKRPHQQGIADVGDARHEGRQRYGVDVINGEDTRGVATREDEEGAAFTVRCIEVNAEGKQTSEHTSVRFGYGDALCQPVFAARIGNHRQQAVLVDRYRPICDGLLVEIGGIDGESLALEKLRSERVNAACFELRTELRDRLQKVSSTEDDARRVFDRSV
jgi:hypothetical protein